MSRKCERCGTEFEVPPTYKKKRYCTRACSSAATAEQRAASNRALGRHKPPTCPCGKTVTREGEKYVYEREKKYCSPECRRTYGKKRQRDESKWETFACGTCGDQVERRIGYGSSISGMKFCSVPCATKHTRKVRHYVLREDDMVLDSTWEVLLVGLLGYLKIPVARVDRSAAVEWAPGRLYAPDLVLPGAVDIYIEVKGYEDEDDEERWQAWRDQCGPLAVIDAEVLESLRKEEPGEVLPAIYSLCALDRYLTKS